MPTPLRAFLMLRDSIEWDIRVSQTLEDVLQAWERKSDSITGAVLHIGFERRPSRVYDNALQEFPGHVFLTSAAKAALPASFKSSVEPVAWSEEKEPLFLATHGWGYLAEDPQAQMPQQQTPTVDWDGWVRQFVLANPEMRDELAAAGIVDDARFQEREHELSFETRRQLGYFRAEWLLEGRWDDPFEIARAVPPWLSALPVGELPLTVRIGNVFERAQITTVADIAGFTLPDMLGRANFGRTSARQLGTIMRNAILAGPERTRGSFPRSVAPTLLVAVRQSLLELDPRSRDIVTRRMGLEGPAETLEQIGQSYGVTRERIRQLEAKAVRRIVAAEYWDDLLAAKVEALLSEREFPLPLIGIEAVDAWFEGIGRAPSAARYILANLCETPVGIVNISGIDYISRMDQARWEGTVTSARNMLKHAIGQEWSQKHAQTMVQGLLPSTAAELKSIIWSEVAGRCHFGGEGENAVLLRYGTGADQIVEAVLFDADQPLHFTEIAHLASARARREIDERRAHNAAAEIGYLFGRGTYGLLKHVPIASESLAAIAEEAAEIVSDGEPSRQWHASELLDELRSRGVVDDDRIDKYLVDIALHEQGLLRSLGRSVWALDGSANEASRIEVRQALIAILQQAGEPLTTQELRQRLIAVRGINSTMQFAVVDPLIKLDASLWGLNDRDLSVKRPAQATFLDSVAEALSKAARPVHIDEAEEVFGSDVPPRALFCLAGNDERFSVGVNRKLHLRRSV